MLISHACCDMGPHCCDKTCLATFYDKQGVVRTYFITIMLKQSSLYSFKLIRFIIYMVYRSSCSWKSSEMSANTTSKTETIKQSCEELVIHHLANFNMSTKTQYSYCSDQNTKLFSGCLKNLIKFNINHIHQISHVYIIICMLCMEGIYILSLSLAQEMLTITAFKWRVFGNN